MEPGKVSLLARLKKVPVWVWITVAIGAAGLIIAYLSYKQQQANGASSQTATNGATLANAAVPAGGSYSPSYSTDPSQFAGYGGYGAGYYGNGNDIQSELAQILALLQSQQGSTVPSGSAPIPPTTGPATWPTQSITTGATGASSPLQLGILQRFGLGKANPPQSSPPSLGNLSTDAHSGVSVPVAASSYSSQVDTHSIPLGVTGGGMTFKGVSVAPIPPSGGPGGGFGANPPTPAPGGGGSRSGFGAHPPIPFRR